MAKTFALAFFILGICARLLFPGDVSFVNDEAKFLKIAYEANLNGDWFALGIEGAKGVKYGPLSILWFRFLLFITQDIFWISNLNILFILIAFIGGIYLISREVKLNFLEISSVAVLSPFLWFYGRNLWDNSINQVLFLYALYFYVKHLDGYRFRFLLISSMCLNGMFHIHPMSLSVATTLALHYFFVKKVWGWSETGKTFTIVLINVLLAYPYLTYFIPAILESSKSPPRRPFRSFSNSLFIAQIFSTYKFSYFLGKGWWYFINKYLGYIMVAVGGITWLSFLASWKSVYDFFKGRLFQDKLLALSVLGIFIQGVMYFFSKSLRPPSLYST